MKTTSICLAILLAASLSACDDKESSENDTPRAQDTDIERQGTDTSSASTESAKETDEENDVEQDQNTDPEQVDSADKETDTKTETDQGDGKTEDTEETEETDTESATDTGQGTDPETDTGTVQGSPPCYGVGEPGCCRGNTVLWCWNDGTNDHLGERDCGADECGWSDKLGWFKCKPPGGSDPVPDGIEAECPSSLP